MRLESLDLNLLVALRALLEHRHVTRAGQQIGLSQPAMSDALGRLRRYFDDELLQRNGNSYELTPLGEILLRSSTEALDSVERTFRIGADFDPATSDRTFTVRASGYGSVVFLQPLIDRIREVAPHVRLRVHNLPTERRTDFEPVLRSVDGMLMPREFLSGFPSFDIHKDQWTCLLGVEGADADDEVSVQTLVTRPWVTAYGDSFSFTPLARQLDALGLEVPIEVVITDFLAVPYFLAGTNRISIVPGRLAQRLEAHPGVRAAQCPIELDPLIEAFWWHPVHAKDSGHAWLRRMLAASAAPG